ncbi:MAG: hypothetical protein KGL53_16515, partial [Elusimicrobia bacterium]|nr:hypothetical protein [Elusimicrobiota bacterium]
MSRKARKEAAPAEPVLGLHLPVPAAAFLGSLWMAFVVVHYALMHMHFVAGDWADVARTLALAPLRLGWRLVRDLLLAAGLWAAAAGLGGELRRRLAGGGRGGPE